MLMDLLVQTSDHKETFFTVRVSEHWNRLPRETMEYPFLEIPKSHLLVVLSSLLQVTLPEQGVGQGTSRSLF